MTKTELKVLVALVEIEGAVTVDEPVPTWSPLYRPPSYRELAAAASVVPSTVLRAVKGLREDGLVWQVPWSTRSFRTTPDGRRVVSEFRERITQ